MYRSRRVINGVQLHQHQWQRPHPQTLPDYSLCLEQGYSTLGPGLQTGRAESRRKAFSAFQISKGLHYSSHLNPPALCS